jgi:hypothetical protein
MSSSDEYREFADECMGWAKTARSDKERAIFLQMAGTWLEAAVALERRLGIAGEARDQTEGPINGIRSGDVAD